MKVKCLKSERNRKQRIRIRNREREREIIADIHIETDS